MTRNNKYVRECVLHKVILQHISVVHWNYVLHMRTIANCKSY